MSRAKTTILLVSGCILAGTALWWLGKPELLPYARNEKRATLLNTRLGEISEISISGRDNVELKFKYDEGSWQMTEPDMRPADPAAIDRLLAALERAPLIDLISKKDCALRNLTDSDLGFDHPTGYVTLFGPRQYRTGIRVTIGDYSSVSNEVFATVGNPAFPNDVCVTTREIADIVNEPDENFIDKRLFRNDPRRVNTIILNQGTAGTIKLVRDQAKRWRITQPVQARADWNVVKNLFYAFYSAEIVHLKSDPRITKTDTGFGEPTAIRMQMFGQDIPAGVSITLGKTENEKNDTVYALLGGDMAVAVISGSVARAASTSLQELRDKRIFNAKSGITMDRLSFECGGQSLSFGKNENKIWTLTSPILADASQEVVAKLKSSVLSLTASKVKDIQLVKDSLQKETLETDNPQRPPLTISFRENGQNYKLKITEQLNDDSVVTQKVYNAVLNRENTIYELRDNPSLEYILECLHKPHLTVSKTILDITEKDISRIEFTRGNGGSEVFERVGREWKTPGANGLVSSTVMSRFFKAIHPLTADAVISVNSSLIGQEHSAADPSCVTLVFTFATAGSLEQTLILGPALPDSQKGYYAYIKKMHTPTYVISQETMLSLTQTFVPLVTPDGDIPASELSESVKQGTSTNE